MKVPKPQILTLLPWRRAFANDREDLLYHFAGFLFLKTDALVDQVSTRSALVIPCGVSITICRVASLMCALLRAVSRFQS